MFEWLVALTSILLFSLTILFVMRSRKRRPRISKSESKPILPEGQELAHKGEIPERDKPFILALVSSGITILNIILTAIGAFQENILMTNTGMDMLKFTFPMVTMAWAFYFMKGKKNEGTK